MKQVKESLSIIPPLGPGQDRAEFARSVLAANPEYATVTVANDGAAIEFTLKTCRHPGFDAEPGTACPDCGAVARQDAYGISVA